ncbi:MAG TPA: glycosyltransferase family 4 protein [Vicinamibacterales bacterium]|nr:glycosyltransferase family 4 protein [Vicinamibacterales bacterium]
MPESRSLSAHRTAGAPGIALLGNHLPRRCGIATFTTHLAQAIADARPGADCFVLAMNDAGHHHAYPSRVRFEIAENDLASYRRAADFLNVGSADVLSVQHEYGIFGGPAGGHVLALLRDLRMPIVTTLHTILAEPGAAQRTVLDEMARLSERLVVMSQQGADLLRQVHRVPDAKIDIIPHGIPAVPLAGAGSKDRLGVQGQTVLFTFGLLSSDKGIEYVIDALPAICAVHPDTVYIVLGATHPHVVEREGETYRLMLEHRAQRLGVADHVIFHDRFVSQEELVDFLSAADIYITPYLQPAQITSGTLAYAVGAGKAVVSTPYLYAREMLADGRGVLVPWRDAASIAREVIDLIGDESRRHALSLRAAEYGRSMLWPAVADRYLESFTRAGAEHAARRRTSFQAQTLAKRPVRLPDIALGHVRLMTDDTGMLQHAMFSVPRYAEGYCLDDNARALMLMARIEDAGTDEGPAVRAMASRYLAFVSDAFNGRTGRFRNFLNYSRAWTEEHGSEDCHGRGLQALGTVVGRARDPGRRSLAGSLFHAALPAVSGFRSPRAWAFTLLGIDEYLHAFHGDRSVQAVGQALAERLMDLFGRVSRPDWPWCEDGLTYCNAQLPAALIVSGAWLERPEMIATGSRSLEWLASVQRSADGYFAPVGSNGFYSRGTAPAIFDQQPVEAGSMVSACLDATRIDGDPRWASYARRAFNWFLGENHLHASLYDPLTGGCRDGLHADRVNENQGAESTLAFLLALSDMHASERVDAAVPALIGAGL